MQAERRKYRLLYRLEEQMEIPMFLLAFFWLYLFIVEFIKGLSPLQETLILIVWGLFIFEYLLKLFLAPRKWQYIIRNWLTLIALVVPALRVFRLFYAVRLLQTTRFITSTKVIRALTSGKRFVLALKEAQGPPPAAEMHVGVLIEYQDQQKLESIKSFGQQLSKDVAPVLSEATDIDWHFHLVDPQKLESDKAVRPSAFLDDASMAMADGPYDAVVVLTDVMVVSRKKTTEAGLASATTRVIVISLKKLTSTERGMENLLLSNDKVRWNGARLLLHLFGKVMGLRESRKPASPMFSYSFSEKQQEVPHFTKDEKEILQRRADRLPERELKGGNLLSTFVFHLLMSFRHIRDVFRPLATNRTLLLPLSLPSLATAAVATGFILVFTAEIWDVGMNMSNTTATVFALLSILASSFYLVEVQSLFLPRKEKKIITEHLAVANTVIYLSIILTCIGLFIMVGGLMIVIEQFVFPGDLMQTWPTLDKPVILWQDKVRLAAFISTVGVTTGALAGGFESKVVIQHLALFENAR